MDNYLKFQIAAALVRDGAYKGGFDELTAALGDVYLGKRYRFGGAATPGLSPGSVNTPTLYATARVGVYAGFSNHSVDAGQVCIFISDDGAEWIKYIIIAAGSGDPDYPQDPALAEYFTIEAKDDAVIKFYRSNYGASIGDITVEVSIDGGQTWTEVTAAPDGAEIADLSAGEKVLVRGDNPIYGGYDESEDSAVDFAAFWADGQCYVYGNIMSLVKSVGFERLREGGSFSYLFGDYDGDRDGDWVLSKAGAKLLLPATTLAPSCYNMMFQGCKSLREAPELPATTLAPHCYGGMFFFCTSLVKAPDLPATTLAPSCYAGMFQGCESLTEAPALPADTLAEGCYNGMFSGCTNLAYIKALFTTTPGTTNTGDWVKGVKGTGTFVKSAAATWNVSGDNGVPTGWTVETA
ncbi:MAG: exo-alpha-sialidase [Oscillibacter sp.]|nr:exo-alpha-sialidase [Oscillibacter sp.]MBR1690615.1 exo-alpha-sialidase [Oscillibacter sp.]